MAGFDNLYLKRVGPQHANAPTIWTYATSDALTAVDASGYGTIDSD